MIKENKNKLSLTSKIFIGLLLGAITGIVIHYALPDGFIKDKLLVNGLFFFIGTGFMRLMQMLVVPLVFFSIISGSMAIGDTKKLGTVGVKTIGFYLVTTALAISIALLVANFINPGIGLDMTSIEVAETTINESGAATGINMLLEIIPTNPFAALAKGDMLQVILFSLIIGVLLASLGEKTEYINRVINEANELMMKMTFAVMQLAPIGVFGLIAKTFSGIGFDAFLPMIKYMFSVMTALVLQVMVVYIIILVIFSRLNPRNFLKKITPILGFAFSTASSGATVPLTISTLEEMGVSRKISSFTIPLGATINMDGTAIMQGVAVVFVAQAYGIDLSISDFLTVIGTATMASVGTAAVPGVGLITLAMVFKSVGLPIEGIGLIMGIDRILDMARTAVNVTGDAVVTTIVASQENLFDRDAFYGKKGKTTDNNTESDNEDIYL